MVNFVTLQYCENPLQCINFFASKKQQGLRTGDSQFACFLEKTDHILDYATLTNFAHLN